MKLVLLAEAEAELDDAAAWYEERRERLGDELLDEVREALAVIVDTPETWPRWPGRAGAHPSDPPLRASALSVFDRLPGTRGFRVRPRCRSREAPTALLDRAVGLRRATPRVAVRLPQPGPSPSTPRPPATAKRLALCPAKVVASVVASPILSYSARMDWVARFRTGFLGVSCAWFAAACGTTSDPEPVRNVGYIMTYDQLGIPYGAASYSEPPQERTCPRESVGDCVVEPACSDDPTPPVIFAAGTVTVQGTPLELNISYFAELPSPVLPGELVEMAATGSADVPAHSGSVRLPPLIEIIEPTVDADLSIDRSTNFEISWTPVEEGTVALSIVSVDMRVSCLVSAGRGGLTVPADALQQLPATDTATLGTFWITQSNSTELRPKGWEVQLYASESVVSGSVDLR